MRRIGGWGRASAMPRSAIARYIGGWGRASAMPRFNKPTSESVMHYRQRPHRRRQYNDPGHVHELTFSCYNRFKFLAAERTCQWLADELERARAELEFHLWAYVFMPEHVHLIVYPLRPKYEIARILKAIKEPMGRRAVGYLRSHAPQWIPRITRRRGQRWESHFWQPVVAWASARVRGAARAAMGIPLLAVRRRIRQQHRRAGGAVADDRIHPPEPGSPRLGRARPGLEMVERRMVRRVWNQWIGAGRHTAGMGVQYNARRLWIDWMNWNLIE